MNLIAFDRRFSTIWRTRPGSASIADRRERGHDGEALLVGERLERRDRLADEVVEVEPDGLEVEPAGLDAGQVEDVVDELEEVQARAVDVLRVRLDGRRVGRLVAALGQQLGEADDRVERRPKLVAHRGQEVALGGARRLELRDQALALDDERLALGGADGALEQELDQLEVVVAEQGVRTEVQLEATRRPAARVERHRHDAGVVGRWRRRAVRIDDDLRPGRAGRASGGPLQQFPDALDGDARGQRVQLADEVVRDRLLAQPTERRAAA